MGLFDSYENVRPEYKNETAESIMAYEECYMKLLRRYHDEIHDIQSMMEELRKERMEFYNTLLPQIENSIEKDNVISNEAKKEWISELRENMERSFKISESLISHYVTKNLEEFKQKLSQELNKV